MSHNTLENYYKSVFALRYHHGFHDIENMIIFEKDIYDSLLKDHFDRQEEAALQESLRQRAIAEKRGY